MPYISVMYLSVERMKCMLPSQLITYVLGTTVCPRVLQMYSFIIYTFFCIKLINNSLSLNKGNHDRDGV